MNYWIFTVASNEGYAGRQIYKLLMEDRFWGLGALAPNRKNLRRGDQVVYYIANPERAFAGTAQLATDSFSLSAEDKVKVSHDGIPFFTPMILESTKGWPIYPTYIPCFTCRRPQRPQIRLGRKETTDHRRLPP
jgi:hypothetical protein